MFFIQLLQNVMVAVRERESPCITKLLVCLCPQPPMAEAPHEALGLPAEVAEGDALDHQAGLGDELAPAVAPGSARRRSLGRSPSAAATTSAQKRGTRSREFSFDMNMRPAICL